MHFNLDFSARQVLWTLNFAAQLVLLVVLLGRDRMRRYPWFTAGDWVLCRATDGRGTAGGPDGDDSLQEIFITLADLAVIVGLLVLVEVARRAFAGAERSPVDL